MKISGFLTNSNPQNYDLVRPIVQLGRFKIKLSAVVVPEMDTTLTMKGYKETSEFLRSKNIKLANENILSDTVGPIPLIIGADYFSKFVGRSQMKHGVQMTQPEVN